MKTIRQRIIAKVAEAISAVPTAADVQLARRFPPTIFPAVTIMDDGETLVSTDSMCRHAAIKLEILGDVVGENAEDDINALVAEIDRALMLNDQWDGLAAATTTGDLLFENLVEGHEEVRRFSLKVSIQYSHRLGDFWSQ